MASDSRESTELNAACIMVLNKSSYAHIELRGGLSLIKDTLIKISLIRLYCSDDIAVLELQSQISYQRERHFDHQSLGCQFYLYIHGGGVEVVLTIDHRSTYPNIFAGKTFNIIFMFCITALFNIRRIYEDGENIHVISQNTWGSFKILGKVIYQTIPYKKMDLLCLL